MVRITRYDTLTWYVDQSEGDMEIDLPPALAERALRLMAEFAALQDELEELCCEPYRQWIDGLTRGSVPASQAPMPSA